MTTRILAIHSYRGGTGKTHFTANLAAAAAMRGRRVAVVDTDVPSPGIHNLFDFDAERAPRTLDHFLWGECAIDEATFDVTPSAIAGTGGSIRLVPASVKADDIARILQDGYDVRRLNDGLRALARMYELDDLFIDTHPGLSRETFLSIAIADRVILVLRPDRQDYQGTAVTVDVARELRARGLTLVVNKAHRLLDPAALAAKVAETYDVPVAGVFPLSEDVAQLASEGLFCITHPAHPWTRELARVATSLFEGH
jgi:MinD-like ATPase involved in chromosome partitioning or flagellar assembly